MKKLICIFLLISISAYPSGSYDKYLTILKKVAEEYIIDHENQILELKKKWQLSKAIIDIEVTASALSPDDTPPFPLPPYDEETKRKIEEVEKKTHHYPDVKMYTISWQSYYKEDKSSKTPSFFFYIRGYPVMIFDSDQPSIGKGVVPKKLRRNSDMDSRLIIEDLDWTIVICKETNKYKVIKKSMFMGVDPIIEELDQFSCHE